MKQVRLEPETLMRRMNQSPTHRVEHDPGLEWRKDAGPAIDAPPDTDPDPDPGAVWDPGAPRTGICGTVTPNVVERPAGAYRMYYTQILPRPGHPGGANDYTHATTRILSATSPDAVTWTPEPGVRLSPQAGGAGDSRVVCPDVVALPEGGYRMYYECCPGTKEQGATIRSAVSTDGLEWTTEPRHRLKGGDFGSPRALHLHDRSWRLYAAERGVGIVSALSEDGGLTFRREPGVRVRTGELAYETLTAFAPEVLRLASGGYRMYYAGYQIPGRAYVLTATSQDGLEWTKHPEPVLSPGGLLDFAKCSEMCVTRVPAAPGQPARYRLFYEACDGTAVDARGVWRILSATSAPCVT